jgi:hypothetical protein
MQMDWGSFPVTLKNCLIHRDATNVCNHAGREHSAPVYYFLLVSTPAREPNFAAYALVLNAPSFMSFSFFLGKQKRKEFATGAKHQRESSYIVTVFD